MAKRQTKKVNVGVTLAKAEEAFAQYAKADAREAQINAEMDVKFTQTRQKYQDELAEISATKEEAFGVMEGYALEHREEQFSKKKSMELVHGTIGFRTSNPALKTRKGFTWASVTEMLKEFLPAYVRTKSEPDKERLLSMRDDENVAPVLAKCGIQAVQAETFYVEPKKEETL